MLKASFLPEDSEKWTVDGGTVRAAGRVHFVYFMGRPALQRSDNPQRTVNTLVFDLDGTLLDTRQGIMNAFRYALQQLGHADKARELQPESVIGPSLRATFGQLLSASDTEDRVETAVIEFRRYYLDQGIYQYQAYPHISNILRTLRQRGYRLILATAKPQAQAELLLAHSGLKVHFQNVYGSQPDGRLSDKRQLLYKIIKNHQLEARHCWMIGDHHLDIRAGRHHGMKTLAVSWGFDHFEPLRRADSHELIHQPAALLRLFPVSAQAWSRFVAH
ncbi:HAD hydrolase-like protein [Marinobacterium arenosum]|uniref:HAD hydrolase-like protein n=1 Tax=Marinobacterium arenosum TaxID=2862496 RepID=UPI001C94D91F|nr:HAD hydrolase-like protein [Marinobacterium arenosum]MBY4678150.1 HAD hydrolase-like protein [Marinobacterium arenosum]